MVSYVFVIRLYALATNFAILLLEAIRATAFTFYNSCQAYRKRSKCCCPVGAMWSASFLMLL